MHSPPPQPSRTTGLSSRAIWIISIAGVLIVLITVAVITDAHSGASSASPRVTVTVPGPTVTLPPPPEQAAALGPGTTMSQDGVYVVGSDIRHGTYHTTGATGGDCYVALLSSTNTDDIIDNNNVTGPDTITVGPGVKAVEVEGCLTWTRTGRA